MKKGWICTRCNKYGFEENQYEADNGNAVPEALEDQTWWDGDETISAEEIAREEWEGRPSFVDCQSVDHDLCILCIDFSRYNANDPVDPECVEYYRYDLIDLDEYYRECEEIQQ